MKTNLNAPVTATLTAIGARIINEYFSTSHIPIKHLPPVRIAGDVINMPLWTVMKIFGEKIHNGMTEVPFVDNEVDIGELI